MKLVDKLFTKLEHKSRAIAKVNSHANKSDSSKQQS